MPWFAWLVLGAVVMFAWLTVAFAIALIVGRRLKEAGQ